MLLNPEQIPTPPTSEEAVRTSFESEEGEKFSAEQLTNPEDSRVDKVQEMLAGHFGEEEVDPPEVMKEAMTGRMATGEECPKYLIHVAENSKGEIIGLRTGAVVETVNAKGKMSESSGVLLGCYSLTSPEARGKGVWKELFKAQGEAAQKDAESRGLKIKGYMSEAHDGMEPVLNTEGAKRAYIKMGDGSFKELPYEQPPLDWDPETGNPTEGAGVVPEHLMLRLASGKNDLSGKELMEMVRGMYYYNNYREEEYFQDKEAYDRHTEFVEGIEQKLAESIGKGKVYLLSRQEREAMQNQGTKFIEHAKKEEKPPAPEAGQEELAKKVKEARFIDRVALLGFKSAEMTDKDISKLRAINDKIEEIDAPWVVRVMDRLQRENLLDSFKPEDVEKLQKIAQEKGYDFEKQGIVSGQVKELASAFKEGRRAEDWQKTFESGGTRTKERLEEVEEDRKTEELTKTLPKGPSLQEGPAPDRTWVFKAQTAEDDRAKTHEEIAGHLLESPFRNSFEIFKKGAVDKLDRACREYALFWEKTGARALKGLSWTGEKAAGYPAGEARKAIWAAREFLLARPGAKRLEKVSAIQANVETLKKSGAISEDEAGYLLAETMKYARHATGGLSDEIRDHRLWEEEKKETLDAMRTFGNARDKLSGWIARRKAEIKAKKEEGTGRRARELAEKLKI